MPIRARSARGRCRCRFGPAREARGRRWSCRTGPGRSPGRAVRTLCRYRADTPLRVPADDGGWGPEAASACCAGARGSTTITTAALRSGISSFRRSVATPSGSALPSPQDPDVLRLGLLTSFLRLAPSACGRVVPRCHRRRTLTCYGLASSRRSSAPLPCRCVVPLPSGGRPRVVAVVVMVAGDGVAEMQTERLHDDLLPDSVAMDTRSRDVVA